MAKKSLSVSMRPLIAGLILFGGFGAGVPSVQANPKATENLQPQAVPPLYREAACDVETVGRPTQDQVFEYKMLDPDGRPGSSGVRHTIRALSGDRVDYWDEIVMPGMAPFPPKDVRHR